MRLRAFYRRRGSVAWAAFAADSFLSCAKVIAASYGFTAIPGVLSVSAGPSVPSPRAVVDSSYDVGVVITVRDRAALAAYLEHPTHKHAVQEVLGPLARQIVVYDFVVSAPQ